MTSNVLLYPASATTKLVQLLNDLKCTSCSHTLLEHDRPQPSACSAPARFPTEFATRCGCTRGTFQHEDIHAAIAQAKVS